jgi:prepilin-type processing-associated H-X9-DG protein
MSFAILGMGTAVPAAVIDQEKAQRIALSLCCRTAEQSTWLPAIYQGSGIATRHMVYTADVVLDILNGTRHSRSPFLPTGKDDDRGPGTAVRMQYYAAEAGPLALRAARQALEQSGLPREELTHLVTVSCTGFQAPGVDVELIQELGLPSTLQRTHVGFMGCHGALNGLRVARAFTAADPGARVLLCATELCSLHYYYGWGPQKVVANALFADGSAAVVGAPAAAGDAWRLTASGSCVFPDSREAMTWTVGDHGFEMTLSQKVPGLIATHLRPWLQTWLREQGLELAQVATWAVHPGGPRILTAVEEALGLERTATEASRAVLAAYGNMSSPTVLFILDHLRERQAPRPCVALGFGPGLAVEAALFF